MVNTAKPCDTSQVRDSQALAGVKILVVDDDPDSCDLTRFILETYRMEVMTAVSALDALEVIEKCQLDILISDIAMPNVDGCSLIRRIRQSNSLNRAIVAIAITAMDGQEMLEMIMQAGFQACLIKPFEEDELIDSIISLYSGLENREAPEVTVA